MTRLFETHYRLCSSLTQIAVLNLPWGKLTFAYKAKHKKVIPAAAPTVSIHTYYMAAFSSDITEKLTCLYSQQLLNWYYQQLSWYYHQLSWYYHQLSWYYQQLSRYYQQLIRYIKALDIISSWVDIISSWVDIKSSWVDVISSWVDVISSWVDIIRLSAKIFYY
jgi:hypothetical protein